MRLLCLVVFISYYASCVSAQDKVVVISKDGVSTNADKKEVVNGLKKSSTPAVDSIRVPNQITNKNKLTDSLLSIQQAADGEQVYSQKQWRQFRDSLSRIPGVNVGGEGKKPLREVSEAELIDAVTKQFNATRGDSIARSTEAFHDPQGVLKSEGLPTIDDTKGKLTEDLDSLNPSDLRMPQGELKDLMPMRATTTKTEYLNSIDSLRGLHMVKEGITLGEKKLSAEQVVTDISPKPRLRDKTYFEGVLGFTPGEFKMFQAAPTIGYHFVDYLSFGLGPNLLVRQEDKKLITTVGLKTFFKAEFLKRQAYFQLEDVMDSYGVTSTGEAGNRKFYEAHNVFAGGGVLLNMHSKFSLNFSLLYNITELKVVGYEYSPMVFRIGISSIK